VPAGTAPVIAVAAQAGHPSNAVLLITRRGGGPAQVMRAIPEATPAQEGAQWYRASLPIVEEGRRFDYRVELLRSGQRLATLPADGSWLTVTGAPAPPPVPAEPGPVPATAPSPAGVPRWRYDLRFFAALTITGRLEVIGETPEGYRINFLVESGSVVGPAIDAVVHRDGGGDWMCIRRDGVAALDIRATYETADGAVTFYRAGGVLDLGPDGYAQAVAGQLTGCPPFYATPKFITAHPDWQWLNRVQGFGIGRVEMEERQVQYDVYIPQVRDRFPDA
jgi:hypothetical protein